MKKETETVALASLPYDEKVVARKRGAWWRLHVTRGEKFEPINKHNERAARHRSDPYYFIEYGTLDEAAEAFGYHLLDTPLRWPIFQHEPEAERTGKGIEHEVSRQHHLKRLWREAEREEEERVYWATVRGFCALTADNNIAVWRNDDGTETLVRLRYGDIRERDRDRMPRSENPAYGYMSEPDCIAILADGTEVPIETIKQLDEVIQTGRPVESARQAKTRRYREIFTQMNAQQENA